MRLRTFTILLIFSAVVLIDIFTKTGNWWFETKIFLVWGLILFDAFSETQKSWIGQISLIGGITVTIYAIQSVVKYWLS